MSAISEASNLLIKKRPLGEGYNLIVGCREKGLNLLEFGRLVLASGEWSGNSGDCEMVVDICSGMVNASIEPDATDPIEYHQLGEREDLFGGNATAVYIPPHSEYRLAHAGGRVDAAVYSSTTDIESATPFVVRPGDVTLNTVGRGDWQREIYTVIGTDAPTSRLILGEVINPGHWSGFPPHKHDQANPPEVPMEEIFYCRIEPSQGYALIRIYTESTDPSPFDHLYVVEDGDTMVVPRGYHPIAVAPGYRMKYTYILAGRDRRLGGWSDEPHHTWLNDA